MNNTIQFRPFATIAACALVASSVGCQLGGFAKLNPLSVTKSKAEEEVKVGTPDRIVATWAEAVLHESGKKGTRGFGGRLFFYGRQSAEPIRVTGQLVIYAFAEEGRSPTDNRPTKRYVFPAEQFAKHETESEAGMSYSVWLPWDEAGGEQTEVSLIARFEPLQGGGLVVSDQTRHRLPGQVRPEAIAKKADSGIRQASVTGKTNQFATQASFREQSIPTSNPPKSSQMTTTTISLPSRFSRSTPMPPSTAEMNSTPTKTTVTYLTPGESVQQSLRSRSFGSIPTLPPDQTSPASPSPFDQTR